jgi:hypothetical protein
LKNNSAIAQDWLAILLQSNADFLSFDLREIVLGAISALSQQQRHELLKQIPPTHAVARLIHHIVAGNPALFRELLGLSQLAQCHLFPLSGHPTGTWAELAMLALETGYSEEQIIQATITPIDPMGWVGLESEMWKGWVSDFEMLTKNSDPRIVKLGQIGVGIFKERMQKSLEEERLESVYGRSRKGFV